MRLLVTGGAGFIGSHFVKRMVAAADVEHITVLDALTYAGNLDNLRPALDSPKLSFVHGNILDPELVTTLMAEHDQVVHFAAESHVDHSFYQAGAFAATNVLGTQRLLDAASKADIAKFVHVSTDEVYGPLLVGAAAEDAPLRPTVPYAASKAASDLLALSYSITFGLPVCVTRSSNNYGPNQHPEKVIPRFVSSLLDGDKVTIHGHGQHVRNWLHVEDNCAGVELVLRGGLPGEVYNLGSGTDLTNRELTALLLTACEADWSRVTYVPDRQANDLRYAMECTKAEGLGYKPQRNLQEGLAETVDWYRRNPDRWAPLLRNRAAAGPHVALNLE
ncbi:dTDP-glucose 4,6-dehydratase [Streptacidiphilus anmyonensis]|uniref:dTDP-glucose 4,6-dehydratase n=1 Tax=Streptacidiphilus anmyonensis TaxID=405782 RepID=UPI0005AAE8D1|nr:dTDP-glucose 4,6-dehydratase [Streptacidiphilus anmyonensis]